MNGMVRRFSEAKTWTCLGLLMAVAVACVLAATGCGGSSPSQPVATSQPTSAVASDATPVVIKIDPGNNPSQGPADAKVTIVEFADFQGLKCASFATDTLPQIRKDYGDTVRFVFVNLPLQQDNKYSEKAAEAGECANAQGSFWPYHDLIFQNQSIFTDLAPEQPPAGVAKLVDALKGFAAQVGMNTAAFNDCLDSGTMAAAVQADIQLAQKAVADAQLTNGIVLPAFFINGRYLGGAKPYDTFVQAIQYVMAVDK